MEMLKTCSNAYDQIFFDVSHTLQAESCKTKTWKNRKNQNHTGLNLLVQKSSNTWETHEKAFLTRFRPFFAVSSKIVFFLSPRTQKWANSCVRYGIAKNMFKCVRSNFFRRFTHFAG